MRKLLLALSLVFATCFAVNAQNGNDAKQADKNQPEFKFDVEEYNFGTVKQGESVHYEFKFSNVGKDPLVITDAHGSCGCTVPEWPKEPIKKGQSAVIKVTFNSAGKLGLQNKTVTITSNAKGGQKVLTLKGNVLASTKQPAK